ncbi:MAG: MFS transporter [Melioribacteraceae bacterium]|nr:MFS transporter [Melioribacteraceae bacterium]
MNKKASLSIIFFTIFIDLLGFGILIPILPTFASKNLSISDFEIGFLIAVFSMMQFIISPILGRFSDRIGRRPIILVTLLITSLSYIIFSFSNSFLILFISRLLAGIGGSNIAVAQAYIADITSREERSKGMGLVGAAFGLGFVFGPLLGGLLSNYGYQVAGYVASFFSFLAFIFAFIYLKESLVKKKKNSKLSFKIFDIKNTLRILSIPKVGMSIILFFIVVFSFANIYGTFSIIGYKRFGFTDQEIGYQFGVIGLVGAIIQGGFINILTNRFKETKLVIAGLLFLMIGLGGIPYGGNFIGVAVVVSLLAIGTGILQPVVLSMVSKYSSDIEQGAILGVNQSLASLARVLGPIWGGFAFEYIGFDFPFITGAFFTFITIIFYLIFMKKLET